MIDERTDATVLFKLVYEAMRRAGLPTDEILSKAGVRMAGLEARTRTPIVAQIAFWTAAEESTKDPDIGLHLGEHIPLFRGQVLEHLLLSSLTFGDGLKRILSYQRLVSDALDAKLVIDDESQGGACYLVNKVVNISAKKAVRHSTECMIMGMLRFFRSVTEGKFNLLHVDLDYSEGAESSEYQRLFGCGVSFNNQEVRVYFDADILSYKLWHSEPELLHAHEQMANIKLQELARHDLVAEVRRAIAAGLENSEVTLDSVAKDLKIETRRLRSLLNDCETSFQQILSDYRCKLAKQLLARTNESVERIVYLTGFSEPSTFYRAFKRWTNETPVEYRKRKQV